MASKPFFSIITPVYNAGQTLERCIKSVLSQQNKDFEFVLIDGASSDGSVSVIKKYVEINTCIKWISEKDGGVYDAMNKGIQMAQGNWLYFLGADDFLSNDLVLQQIEEGITSHTGYKLFYGDVWFEDLNRKYDGPFTPEKLLRRSICHPAIFYHHTIFKTFGFYALKFPIEADYVFNLKIFLDGRIQTFYLPVLVATFASGGMSNRSNDPVFKNKYGRVVFSLLFQSHLPFLQKLKLMAITLSKIRYRTFLK
jgi:glycosyltransferase involved in cell wall biosynthesis